MSNFADDKAFEERFHPHYQEIAGLITRPSVASETDDFKYNTDLGLSLAEIDRGDGVMVRFAARVRRSEEHNNSDVNGHPRTMEFTMRYSRPSGIPTEWLKVADGWGDYMIYGFESEPGSDRLAPWVLLRLSRLRAWGLDGWRSHHDNVDDSSTFVVFHLEDIPPDVVLHINGIPKNLIGSRGCTAKDVAADRECGHRRQATSCAYCAVGVAKSDFYDMMRLLNQRRRGRR